MLLGLLISLPLQAQRSRCADCHFANPDAPNRYHLDDWDHSVHGRQGVGCERCHGGDATTFESFRAHRVILNSRNPASPVHWRNLPRTCGTCHPGPYVAFQESRHHHLLEEGREGVPVCSTCHGEVAARLLSPRGLFAQCSSCHGEGKSAPRPEYPPRAGFSSNRSKRRHLLEHARILVERVRDPERKARLREEWEQAQVPLTQCAQGGHRFVFDRVEERLALARQRVEALNHRSPAQKQEGGDAPMKTAKYWLPSVAVLLLALGCAREERPPGVPEPVSLRTAEEALEVARHSAEKLTEEIRRLLMSELEKGGFEGAVRVCSEEAPRLSREFAREWEVEVRRVSLRPRSPAAVPDALERELLEEMDRAAPEGRLHAEYHRIVETQERRSLRYLKPLVTAPLCITCHGPLETIPEPVRAVLSERYPQDRATGYRPGQVRGAVSVTIPVRAEKGF